MILEMLVLSYSKIIYEMVIHDVSYYQNEELLDSYFQVIIDLHNGQREGSLINYQG